MSLHAVPLCYRCTTPVEADKVYAAPCDHEDCPSSVFHPICLMEWREHREGHLKAFESWVQKHNIVAMRHVIEGVALEEPEENT